MTANRPISPMQHTCEPCYDRDALLECGQGLMFGAGNAQLPRPNMLMFDRITHIDADGGAHGKGVVRAELDLNPDLWFFHCHFVNDPVMPGCLGLDALWQLIGFSLAWRGGEGRGRALGAGEVKFFGQITPENRRVLYEVEFRRVSRQRVSIGIADGTVMADDTPVYSCRRLRVGLFPNMAAWAQQMGE